MVGRIYKTGWFTKAARKAQISDSELREAIRQVAEGQADDLGGGVFKKRLKGNRHRSIILANAGKFWVFAYLFAKKDRANIDDAELAAFKALAALYRKKTVSDIETELQAGALMEIGDENET
ncbi:plasmid stabilization system protein (plasmid) [Rhizobium phaseoli]|uniref:type II toxin-antitoxin system RelE/ParE family toxin n=1 Tax=Rhizobium phaseoli TaxID=396 RepID=UPI0007EB6A2F|nr:type II toxin-antitoxin system RelE/ParE family toxin [Rhizobium phaseoli]ANL49387.1 plasmid stabilization system protein [Rhizobium phaseoli]PDS30803.1 addiction module toxin RelE [Rhizobium phaseoli]